ncbi:MAG: hypothetical protein IJZ30_02135 [Alphaproteobacteria bacterium]|nr:hypothetical protein [Alphaproteobacteria bacterium]
MNKNNKKDVTKLNFNVNITKEKYKNHLFIELPNNISKYPHSPNINRSSGKNLFTFGEKNVFVSSNLKHKK